MDLYIDATSGAAGDMFLAGMVSLGVDLKPLEQILQKAGLDCEIQSTKANRAAGVGHCVHVHSHSKQPLRHLPDMLAIVDKAELSDQVKQLSKEAFTRLGMAEAKVHGCALEEIHFHEVGAVDTIVDVVGAFWACEQLNIESVRISALPSFSGFISCDHGRIPLPAPATLQLLFGQELFATDAQEELITPTGALLLGILPCWNQTAEHTHDVHATQATFVIHNAGTGYGTRDTSEWSQRGLRLIMQEYSKKKVVQPATAQHYHHH